MASYASFVEHMREKLTELQKAATGQPHDLPTFEATVGICGNLEYDLHLCLLEEAREWLDIAFSKLGYDTVFPVEVALLGPALGDGVKEVHDADDKTRWDVEKSPFARKRLEILSELIAYCEEEIKRVS
ncbi:hypothetical protein EXT67_20505 [Pectobacterium atrosepticum]|uniref:Uncharacterized protein n=1 Tax=Pectobacterium phage phiTE TaxID=1116482 RepID=K9L3S0_9CAUD|nr:hypothetical protein [Pectobacterium atrosepticum]YP_007392555.1 hypothetical protein phiTE_093 [Pectobacterium phage phiTE]AEZ66259.1 hypothetical protein phiTE_093 [Pectobacterium phage phiTE]MCL6318688.1 hypothetical protein [Pectobacterium atrosepticum]